MINLFKPKEYLVKLENGSFIESLAIRFDAERVYVINETASTLRAEKFTKTLRNRRMVSKLFAEFVDYTKEVEHYL